MLFFFLFLIKTIVVTVIELEGRRIRPSKQFNGLFEISYVPQRIITLQGDRYGVSKKVMTEKYDGQNVIYIKSAHGNGYAIRKDHPVYDLSY